MRRLLYAKSSVIALVTTLAALAACDKSAPRGPGAIRIAASTQLAEPFFFSYAVSIDGGSPTIVPSLQPLTFLTAGLAHGKHAVTVDSVPAICTGDDRQEVDLRGDDTVAVIVFIQCPRTSGDVRVTVATTGTDLDPTGYGVAVDQQQFAAVPTNGSVIVQFLQAGSHTVSLFDVAQNCTAPSAQTVTVAAGVIANVNFTVMCSPLATIRLTTSASGTERDPDGVTLKIDAGEELRAPLTGTLNGTTSAGTHSYVIGDVAPNCTLGVPATGTVTLAQGEVATINTALTCADVGYGVEGVVHTDPINDTLPNNGNPPSSSAAHDVRTVSGRYVSGWLLVVLRFGRPPGSSGSGSLAALYGVVDFDVDENASTGASPFINSFGGTANQGSDYAIDVFDTDSISAAIYKFSSDGGIAVGRVRAKFEGDSVVLQLPLNKLGGDDGNMTITGVVGTADRPTDIFPNTSVIVSHAPTGPMVAARQSSTAVAGTARSGVKRPTLIKRAGKWKVPR